MDRFYVAIEDIFPLPPFHLPKGKRKKSFRDDSGSDQTDWLNTTANDHGALQYSASHEHPPRGTAGLRSELSFRLSQRSEGKLVLRQIVSCITGIPGPVDNECSFFSLCSCFQ